MVQPSQQLYLYCLFKAATNTLEHIGASLDLLMYEGNWIVLEPYSVCSKLFQLLKSHREPTERE